MTSWTLYHGDALALLQSLPSSSVDCLLTDGPYSSGGMVRSDRVASVRTKYVTNDSSNRELEEFHGDNRDQRAFGYWCTLWLSECLRVTKVGAPAMLFSDWRQVPITTDVLQAGGFIYRGLLPWLKPNARPQRGRFAQGSEFVVWGSHGPMASEGPCLRGWFEYESPRDRKHITQKPVGLMRELVKICPPGGTVLDPFAGSVTTGVAALLEGRRFIGFELSDHFANLGAERLRSIPGGEDGVFVRRRENPIARGAFERLRIQQSSLHEPNGS